MTPRRAWSGACALGRWTLVAWAVSGTGARATEVAASPPTEVRVFETPALAPPAVDVDPTDVMLEDYERTVKNRYSLFYHRRTYVMPYTYNWRPHDDIYADLTRRIDRDGAYYRPQEAEFQVSFMLPIYQCKSAHAWDVIFAYTHRSWWQVYNPAWSRPFRETNYNPEFFARRLRPLAGRVAGLKLVVFDVGYAHQSNGQIEQISRSWDRLFVRGHFSGGRFGFTMNAWVRLPEAAREDDNASILAYMGFGSLTVMTKFGEHAVELTAPVSLKPGVEIEYSYPWMNRIRWYVNARYGYAQSMIEYNRETARIGFGLAMESPPDGVRLAPPPR